MIEQHVPSPLEDDGSGAPRHETEASNVVYLDEYRQQRELLQQIGAVAMTYSTDERFRPEPLYMTEHPDGSITVKFCDYQPGFTGDGGGLYHSEGWSGEAETRRLLRVHYSAYSGEITSGYVGSRNLLYAMLDAQSKENAGATEAALIALQNHMRS